LQIRQADTEQERSAAERLSDRLSIVVLDVRAGLWVAASSK
jgi:hypothetical protein